VSVAELYGEIRALRGEMSAQGEELGALRAQVRAQHRMIEEMATLLRRQLALSSTTNEDGAQQASYGRGRGGPMMAEAEMEQVPQTGYLHLEGSYDRSRSERMRLYDTIRGES